MSLTIQIELPPDIEQRLRSQDLNLDAQAKEAFMLELFRQGRLSRNDLGRALSLDRHETEGLLVRHHIFTDAVTHEDVDGDVAELERLLRNPL